MAVTGRRILAGSFRIALTAAALVVGGVLALKLVFTQPLVGQIPTEVTVRADAVNIRRHVEFLCNDVFPRNTDHLENLNTAASYIAEAFALSGGQVHEQVFDSRGKHYRNIIVSFGPRSEATFVLGAHYDVFGNLPGADDNASGVATLIELGRVLGRQPLGRRVDLVAYTLEEPPFFGSSQMGSAVHARAATEAGLRIRGMVAIEMVGYFTDRQPWDNLLLQAIYRSKGDFVMVAGRWQDRKLVTFLKRALRGASTLPVLSLAAPSGLASDASDHRNYWLHGFPAVMLTDTATIRNHNYHTARDRPDTLDYDKMAMLVDGLYGVVVHLDQYGGGIPN